LLEAGMRLMSEGVREAQAKESSFKTTHMRVVCVLGPPWFFGTVAHVVKDFERPTEASERLYTALVDDSKRAALDVEGAVSWRTVVGDAGILETTSQSLLLNGYPVTSFAGQSVSQASLSVYVALVGVGVQKHVAEILERVLPNHDIHIMSSTSLLATLYRSTMGGGSANRGYVVEVGGHVTGIATMERGVLAQVSTIPFGTNDILTAAAPEAVTAEEARGKLFIALKGKEQNTEQPLPDAVQRALTEWKEGVHKAFCTHSGGAVPHELVLLMVGTRWHSLLIPLLKEPWMMPGIRENHAQVITPVSVTVQPPAFQYEPSKQAEWPALADSRLQVFTHSLFCSPKA